MSKYEALYIVKPDVEEEPRAALIEKFKGIVESLNGTVENIDEWGKKALAYPIDYIKEGYYVLMNFEAGPDVPAELERNYKISEFVIRYMIINKDEE